MAPVGQTFTLLPDFRMTRRKRYHILLDVEREHVLAAIDIAEVFEHVLEADRKALIVETDTQNYVITINRLPGPPGEPPRPQGLVDQPRGAIDLINAAGLS